LLTFCKPPLAQHQGQHTGDPALRARPSRRSSNAASNPVIRCKRRFRRAQLHL